MLMKTQPSFLKTRYAPIILILTLLAGCNGEQQESSDTSIAKPAEIVNGDDATLNHAEPVSLLAGKTLFNQACAGCHGKDLAGGAGFNLKDGEWIHGKSAEKITRNVNNGFSSAGMPGFKSIYSVTQISQIVGYVMSKREGFDNLTFALYALDDKHDQSFEGDKPIKTGTLTNNLADFSLPEIPDYGIVFSGDFYAPQDQVSALLIEGPAWRMLTNVKINGEQAERTAGLKSLWPLQKGKQHIEVTFLTSIPEGLDKKQISRMPKRDLSVVVANETGIVRYFPVSTKAKSKMKNSEYKITSTSAEVVIRKKVYNLPHKSISVGLPNKINYAFNPTSCDIVGVWQGELLDIGANIDGRGQEPSVALGKFVLTHPNYIGDQDKLQPCHFNMYERLNTTRFHYEIAGVKYVVTASSTNENNLRFQYLLEANDKSALNKINMNIPSHQTYTYSSDIGEIQDNHLTIEFNNSTQFYIDIQFAGAK